MRRLHCVFLMQQVLHKHAVKENFRGEKEKSGMYFFFLNYTHNTSTAKLSIRLIAAGCLVPFIIQNVHHSTNTHTQTHCLHPAAKYIYIDLYLYV